MLPTYIQTLSSKKILFPACGHKDIKKTVTISAPEGPYIVCENCYQTMLPELEEIERNRRPLVEMDCFLSGDSIGCSVRPSRMNPEMNLPFCDACVRSSKVLDNQAPKRMRDDILPDLLSTNDIASELYIGPKESAMSHENLQRLNIGRVLVCCSHLPEYLSMEESSIHYHRLPMADSLDQSLIDYIPSALAFIAQGVLEGHATLVHCNAGVSRSGSIAVAWLMSTRQMTLTSALAAAKEKRQIITPNSNFICQLREKETEIMEYGVSESDIPSASPRLYASLSGNATESSTLTSDPHVQVVIGDAFRKSTTSTNGTAP